MNYAGIFLTAVILDFCYARWMKATVASTPGKAAVYSMAIGGLGLVGLVNIVDDHLAAIPWILGLGWGSYLGALGEGDGLP